MRELELTRKGRDDALLPCLAAQRERDEHF